MNAKDEAAAVAAADRKARAAALRVELHYCEQWGKPAERTEQVRAALAGLGEPLEDAAESKPRQRAVPKRRA